MPETDEEKKKREEREEQERKDADAKKKGGKGGSGSEDDDDDEDDIEKVREDRDKWKREARKWEDRAKQNSEKAKKYDEIEAKNKTAEERLADLEKKGSESSTELLRLRVGMRKGLTEAQIKRLVGKTEEELEADADELLETFTPKGKEDEGNGDGKERQRRPSERLRTAPRTGARGRDAGEDEEPSKDEVKKIVDRAMEVK